MIKKTTFLKTLLVAAGLLVGTSSWADGNKRVLDSQNYENATASDWTSKNGSISLGTGDATYGNYSKVNVSGNGNRTCAKTISFAYEAGSGYTTADMTTNGYVIEFDMQMSSGNVKDRSVSQFLIGTSAFSVSDNATYTGTDYVFAMSQPTRDASSRINNWYINDLNNSGSPATIAYNTWYHYKFVVSASSVAYTISHGETEDATGSLTVTQLPNIKGFYGLLGRGSGYIYFDNLEIYDYTANLTVSAPTFAFNKVDGAGRVYTITNTEGSGTLYYTTAPAEEAPAVGDAAYTYTSDLTKEVTFSESGKYYAYVLHTNGTTASAITTQAVTAGALTLTAPVFTIVDMVQAEDGYYYPKVTFASNNSSLEGAPTATLDKASPYTFTGVGSLTVTASAEGYTSSSNTFKVNSPYVLNKTIDFGALTSSDFDGTIWETATGAPRDKWTDGAAAIPEDVTYYKLKNTSATAGEPDNSAVLNGITISNYYQRAPQVYIGYGLLTPYDALGGSGNNMNFTVNGGTASDYIVYNGWNNYGSGTFNTVLAGNATFGLYRYDTMLRTIKVYSPSTLAVTIKTTGTTFSSAYAIDCSKLPSGVKAYKVASIDKDNKKAILAEVTEAVKAETGLILIAETAGTFNIPVAATGTDISATNLLKAAVTATTVAAEDNKYGLSAGNFVKLNAGSIPAGKAYLEYTSTPGAPELDIDFGGTTGISTMHNSQCIMHNEIYDLQGRKVAKPTKGLYIVNGKKVIVK